MVKFAWYFIRQILNMVVEQDVTKEEVRKAIFDKHEELDPYRREFNREMQKLRAEHAR